MYRLWGEKVNRTKQRQSELAQFKRYIGIHYSGAEVPEASCRGFRVYVARASFGSYDVDETKHRLTPHVQGSVTGDILIGRTSRQFTSSAQMGA